MYEISILLRVGIKRSIISQRLVEVGCKRHNLYMIMAPIMVVQLITDPVDCHSTYIQFIWCSCMRVVHVVHIFVCIGACIERIDVASVRLEWHSNFCTVDCN